MNNKGQNQRKDITSASSGSSNFDAFVLNKGIFSNVFDKDIRRVYIYKKAERLAKAIHLIAPAFRNSSALREKLDLIAVGLVDGAVLPPALARERLSRELLSLSSVLSIARAGGILSVMNADVIGKEAHALLEEIAGYEEPRLVLEEVPTLATLARTEALSQVRVARMQVEPEPAAPTPYIGQDKGHIVSDTPKRTSRRDAVLAVLKEKGPSYIKDISMVIREVSEKTIQRELAALVAEGKVSREGERRWTTYALSKDAGTN